MSPSPDETRRGISPAGGLLDVHNTGIALPSAPTSRFERVVYYAENDAFLFDD
jgi:hypothetical protein